MMKKLLFLLIVAFVSQYVLSQDRATFTAVQTGDWNSGSTWDQSGATPGSGDDVVIGSGYTVTSTTSTDAAGSINVGSTATLTINSGATLTTAGDVSVDGTLTQNGTLNVGDNVADGFIIDGGTFEVGNNSTTNISGYYKQTNAGTVSSSSGYSATVNIATSGALNDDVNPVLSFINSSIADFNGADVDFNILDGNTSSVIADVVIEAPGTSSLSWIGTVTFGSGASTTVADWLLDMEASTGLYEAAVNIGSGGTFTLEQTTFSGTGILFQRLDLLSGDFYLAPLANLNVPYSGGINITGGTLTIESDNTGSGELICESVPITATVQQFITGQQWHQITPITTGTTTADIFQNNSPQVWLMNWDLPSQDWQYIIDPSLTDPINVGEGYIVTSDYITKAYDFTIEYNGDLRVSDYTKPSYTATAGDFELIGNPYASSVKVIDLSGLLNSSNLDDDIWIWNPSADNYATATGGAGGTLSGNVAPGQCFFVKATSNGPTTLSLLASNRTFSSTNNFYKKSEDLINWNDNFGKGIYAMFKVTDSEKFDATFVNFGENGSPDFESNFDGTKRFGSETSPQLYLVENNLSLSIDYIKTLDINEDRIVKLNFKAGKDGEHIMAANLDSLENTLVTLEDLQTGKMHVFNTEGNYVFNASTNDSPDRFLLHFLYNPTGIENPSSTGVESSMNIYAFNKAVYITNKDNNPSESLVTIYDLVGRQVYSNEISLTSTTKIPINVSNTYLIVKVIKGSEVVTQKVFIQ